MKCEIIKEEAPKVFEPVSFKFVCESEKELRTLWHRLNISIVIIRDNFDGCPGELSRSSDMLVCVNNAMLESGVKP